VSLNIDSWLEFAGNLAGILGTMLIVFAYYSIEKGSYSRENFEYYLINLIGSILLLISLLIDFNLGSVIVEFFWAFISLLGIVRIFKQRSTQNKNNS